MAELRYLSSRGGAPPLTLSEAIRQGLAPDGGLYVPTRLPEVDVAAVARATRLPDVAQSALRGFFQGDRLEPNLADIARTAFDFPAPTTAVEKCQDPLFVLELFHGPTAAFKDFGARFLAAALSRLRGEQSRPLQILVATSGDTGGAVAAAFHGRHGIEVTVLYPKGLVSPTQEQQLTCWGGNVRALAVLGRFDDCQRLVKEAFADAALRERFELSSANSINLGRLLPQTVYYWAASLRVARAHHEAASFVIPSGNLGNATACIWARRLGAPIASIVLAHNANRTVPDYLRDGGLRPRPSVATISSAMDVGNPSNLERLSALYPDVAQMRGALSAQSISDEATRTRIRLDFERYGRIWCPHSAVAAEAYMRLAPAVRTRGRWVVVATAHPAKFREIIEPLIGEALTLPPNLARLYDRPAKPTPIEPDIEALKRAL